MVSTAGSPSGTAATARETPISTLSASDSPWAQESAASARQSTIAARSSQPAKRWSRRCSGVGRPGHAKGGGHRLPDLRVGAGRRDRGVPRAAGDDGRRVEGGTRPLLNGQRFAGDRGLVHLQPIADQVGVSRHAVPPAEPDQVADDQLLGAEAPEPAVPDDACRGSHHLPQPAARALGPSLLEVAQRGVGEGDRDDDARVEQLAYRQGDRRGEPEEGHHRIGQLPADQLQARWRRCLGDPVRPVSPQPCLGLTRRQAARELLRWVELRFRAHPPETMTATGRAWLGGEHGWLPVAPRDVPPGPRG